VPSVSDQFVLNVQSYLKSVFILCFRIFTLCYARQQKEILMISLSEGTFSLFSVMCLFRVTAALEYNMHRKLEKIRSSFYQGVRFLARRFLFSESKAEQLGN